MLTPTNPAEPLRLIAAPFTPFTSTGELQLKAVPRQAEQLRASGVFGAFVGGTTGEFASLNTDERKALAEAWRDNAGDLQLIVHVGSCNIREAKELARHAQQIGADAIGAVPPFYYRPSTTEALVASVAPIANAAPELPFLYYHIPGMSRVDGSMVAFVEAAVETIATFAGVKFTHSDLLELADCLEVAPEGVEIMFGRDPLLLSALALGAVTAVGSTFNFAAPLYHEMAEALRAGDFETAKANQRISSEMIKVCNAHGGLVAQKAITSMVGVDCGPARAPFRPLDDAALADLTSFLERHSFFTSDSASA